MSNKMYDALRWISTVFFPAFITLYGVIAATCNIPYTEQVLTIMVALNTFLGSLLGISNSLYKKEQERKKELWESIDYEEE